MTPKIPASLKYIIGNEAAERFSYYGLRAILTVYLAGHFFNPTGEVALQAGAEAKANEATHFFITLNYLLPIAGALLSDWFVGKYRIILWLSIVYSIGNIMMAAGTDNYTLFMTGLVLIAIGSGGIKPCVSANVGDQFDESNRSLMSKAFSWFYLSINFGSFFSTLCIPYVLHHYGAKAAFGIPGILMILATVLFVLGRKKYVRIPPAGFPKLNFVSVSFFLLTQWRRKQQGESFKSIAISKYPEPVVDAIFSVWEILGLFLFVPVYWMLSDQSTSEWVLQATKLDLHLFGVEVLPQQVQAANPVFILLITPLFSSYLYPWLERKGIIFSTHRRMLAGFLLLSISFLIIFGLEVQLEKGFHPSVWWQILAYFFLTVAEILVYLTGLEYAYAKAPASMKSTIMSFWLLTISLGNYLVSCINSNISHHGMLSVLHGSAYYAFFIALILAMIILFSYRFRRYIFKSID